MEEDIQLDPALTSGVDEGIGRRGVDWDYVKQAVTQHHQGIRAANRRRGQDTFNRLIGQGVAYADALKQAGDDGLFFDDNEGQQRAYQHMETLKAQSARAAAPKYHPAGGMLYQETPTGLVAATPPPVKKPDYSELQKERDLATRELFHRDTTPERQAALRLKLGAITTALKERGATVVEEPELTPTIVPPGRDDRSFWQKHAPELAGGLPAPQASTNMVPSYPRNRPAIANLPADDIIDVPSVPVNQKTLTADIAKDFVKQARGDKVLARKLAKEAGFSF